MATASWAWSQIIKGAASLVAASSAASTIRTVIENNVETETALQALQLKITKLVVGGAVYSVIWDRTGTQIQSIIDVVSSAQKTAKRAVAEEKQNGPKPADATITVDPGE